MQSPVAVQLVFISMALSHFVTPIVMIVVCGVCNKEIRREQSTYQGVSHGYCPDCEKEFRENSKAKIQKYLEKRASKNELC